MSPFLKKLSKIDKKTKYGVYGWIRKAEQELQSRHIPLMISNICLLYYYQDEIFDVVSKDVKILYDGKSVIKIGKHIWWNNTNYGINEILSNTNSKYQWDFKIIHLQHHGVMIGIMDSKQICADKYFFELDEIKATYVQYGRGWNYDTIHRRWTEKNRLINTQFKQNDKVSMVLDLSTSTLKFVVNDKFEINAFDNISKSDDIKYKMFVSLLNKDDSVRIIDFSRK